LGMPLQIGIVMLGVRDLGAAIEFYRDRLGLTVKGSMGGFAFLDAGAVTLCLSEPLARATANLAGATELVFPVEGVRDAFQSLQGKGITFLNEPRNVTGPNWAANFKDLDGHNLSIFGPE
jgi:catechol 2,3-dioxygenase-like lactoylglutathione lyase family enzyme